MLFINSFILIVSVVMSEMVKLQHIVIEFQKVKDENQNEKVYHYSLNSSYVLAKKSSDEGLITLPLKCSNSEDKNEIVVDRPITIRAEGFGGVGSFREKKFE